MWMLDQSQVGTGQPIERLSGRFWDDRSIQFIKDFGSSLGWELRGAVSVSSSTLVALMKAPASSGFPSSSSSTRGLSEACQRKGLDAGQECTVGCLL